MSECHQSNFAAAKYLRNERRIVFHVFDLFYPLSQQFDGNILCFICIKSKDIEGPEMVRRGGEGRKGKGSALWLQLAFKCKQPAFHANDIRKNWHSGRLKSEAWVEVEINLNCKFHLIWLFSAIALGWFDVEGSGRSEREAQNGENFHFSARDGNLRKNSSGRIRILC